MKKLFSTFALLAMNFSLLAASRDAQWKQVEDAASKGLPQSAITNLEPIIQGALKDKAYAEAVKAIGRKLVLEGNIQGNKPEEKIVRLEAELAKAPTEMKPMLETLLAHWYWHYFQQNRYRFLQRTATATQPGPDFTTWDLPRLFAEIDKHFQAALAADATLKAIPVADWNDLLTKGTMPDTYRPTLYDFIACEALEFYTSGEQAGAKPEEAFESSANGPIFDPADKFLAWNPSPADPASSGVKAIRLYQALLRFHQNDPAPRLAFAGADLERLTWGNNSAFGEDKEPRYKTALESFIRTNADFEVSALALEREARLLQQQDDLVAARNLAQRGADMFPDSPGGKRCRNLVTEIKQKGLSISTESVWNCFGSSATNRDACSTIDVTYRNIEVVHFRAIPYDWEVFLKRPNRRPQNLNDQERREILSHTPALEWSEKLVPTSDYKQKTISLSAPIQLKPGFYFIVASHDPKFVEAVNLVSMTTVWVSDLALVTRTRAGLTEGFVLEAGSGEPIQGAEVAVWHLDTSGNRVADPTLKTDENGFFSFKPEQSRAYLFRARHNGRELATADDLYNIQSRGQGQPTPSARTVFFTDRAIYRPGQTIQYKGICLEVDPAGANYEVLKGEQLTVIFRDQNNKEIARQTQHANDFGSFAGSFTAPRDRVTGRMTLRVEGRAGGQTSLRVEEYKRPKFEVTLEAPKTAPKLNDRVSLTGHATSYTGAAIDNALIQYHVIREVRMPWWWAWRRSGVTSSASQEIAHGTARTETDGSFSIEFVARPDPKVLEKDEPTFVFAVNADVTDSAGETRSANRGVRVGYTALEAVLHVEDWQTTSNPVEIKIQTATLDGEPQLAEGSIKVYDLQAPERVQRPPLGGYRAYVPRLPGGGIQSASNDDKDLSNPNNWPQGKVIAERGFTTDTNGQGKVPIPVAAAGAYRVVIETQDRFGKKVTGLLPLQVLKPEDTRLAIKIPNLLAAPKWESQPGEEFMALWGTGYETGRAFIEIEHHDQKLQRFWTKPGQTQQQIKLAVTEALRGGFFVHVTRVREDRAYLVSHKVEVSWLNKELDLKWEHFVSKLQPAQKETWTLTIAKSSTPTLQYSNSPERFAAELVATLYDESLDAFVRQNWPRQFNIFYSDYSTMQPRFANAFEQFTVVFSSWYQPIQQVEVSYRAFPRELTENLWMYQFARGGRGGAMGGGRGGRGGLAREAVAEDAVAAPMPMNAPLAATAPRSRLQDGAGDAVLFAQAKLAEGAEAADGSPKVDLGQVTARKNLNETAFFYPQLTSDSNGIVRMTFTMPEALTKWHFIGFAHDQSVRSGLLEGHAVTAKDLMVQPNPPRFLREGDTVEFTVKVSNQSDKPQTGRVRLSFNDALTGQSADAALQMASATSGAGSARTGSGTEQDFSIPAKESRSFAWRITVPDGCGFLTYKTVGAAANVSDGEEGSIPVLSRRILITESLPLPIRGPATKKFAFTRLIESGSSKTLQNQNLTVQMVSNPAWYAVLALPYLMEYPYECSEQIFNRFYANSLARSIATHDPKVRTVFERWKNTPALDSPLEKNQDLKSVALEETPWLRQAKSESEARRNVGVLFDDNRLTYEIDQTLQKLTQMQMADGSWPWFPGGYGNDYITLYITTGFGRLRHLGVDVRVDAALRSLRRLDTWMTERYDQIQRNPNPDLYVPSPTDALYLYGRSFFLKDLAIPAANKKAVDFFLAQSRKFWLQTDWRQTQGQLALALFRFNKFNSGNDATPAAIMASIKERSVSSEEMGMFWRDTELSWWWYRAPIETQALMIEAFDEVAQDQKAVEDCKVWLLKQKQTRDWKTTKATADAVYALLLRGQDLLSSDALVQIQLDGLDLTPGQASAGAPKAAPGTAPEPGTGFYEVRFTPAEIKPALGDITVKKTDAGVAWGSVNWQYLEDMSKVTPYEGTPLKLKKSLFTKKVSSRGPVLEPVTAPVQVGDELVVRIELRVDRDMEYVHLKDQRGSGTEPVNVLSRYKRQDGLAYYESTRDTASHFFIDYLPKGVYVFEYSTRVQLRGAYQTGVAEIQCMYAPEFNSHSESIPITVR